MNIHAPKNALTKWKDWEFRGHRFEKHNKTWIRARHTYLNFSWYYCFDLDEMFCTVF